MTTRFESSIAAALLLTLPGPPAAAALAADGAVSLRSAQDDCVDFATEPLTEKHQDGSQEAYRCRVAKFTALGRVDGSYFYAALYCFSDARDPASDCYPEAPRYGGLAVYERPGKNKDARVAIKSMPQAAGDLTFQWYLEPQIFRNPSGSFLVVPAGRGGTAAENVGDYYLWLGGRWTKLDSGLIKTARGEDWAPYLPSGATLESGMRPDMYSLTAEQDLIREGGSPGVAHVKLAVADGRFIVHSVYVTGGHTTARSDDNAEDLQTANEALSADPRDGSAYFARALAYSNRGDAEKALSDFDEGLKLAPRDAGAYNDRGLIYDAMGEHSLAVQDYTRALELAPKNPRIYNNRGSAYADLGDDARAIQDYSRALELSPRFSAALKNRAAAYLSSGDREDALRDGRNARRLTSHYGKSPDDDGFSFIVRGEEARPIGRKGI